jgi:hypothetical protein
MKLGNAGGGKGPDFRCAFEEEEVKVIGDQPAYDPGPSEEAVSDGPGADRGRVAKRVNTHRTQGGVVRRRHRQRICSITLRTSTIGNAGPRTIGLYEPYGVPETGLIA